MTSRSPALRVALLQLTPTVRSSRWLARKNGSYSSISISPSSATGAAVKRAAGQRDAQSA